SGIKSLTFATRQTEQRWFALMAERYFHGVRIHSFNTRSGRVGHDRSLWWRSHSGLNALASEYLKLMSGYLR
ncbi:MAG: hypothetical protein H6R26_877, partial [Proteobacteria bacterium]|nr:hypothetical protein [Pseudomonadota bacterium]